MSLLIVSALCICLNVANNVASGFFDTFNAVFPLLDRQAFNENYQFQYSGMPVGGPAWYAVLNVVLCLGSMICHAHSQDNPELSCLYGDEFTEKRGWKYFRNACSCFTDLMFQDCNLMAIQAICGMVGLPCRKADLG
jgi:hypothetical protein